MGVVYVFLFQICERLAACKRVANLNFFTAKKLGGLSDKKAIHHIFLVVKELKMDDAKR